MIELEHACAQLRAGDPSAYETLRTAWRVCRCAELAVEVERVGRAIGRPAIELPKPKDWQAAWVARAREGDPLDLAGQLAGVAEHAVPRHASLLAACLDELMPHADDPQLTLPLLALLEVRATSSVWNKVHTRIFQLLEAAGDPRAIAGLEPAIARAAVASPDWSDGMRRSLGRAARTRDRLLARFPAGVPALPASLRPFVDAIARITPVRGEPGPRAKPGTDLSALLQAIYDDPTDLGCRMVYGDALQQRGDPRGELIMLQLSGRPDAAARIAKLIAKHRRVLLGSIAKTVIASTAEFEAGFLAACETDVRRKAEAGIVFGRPEWGTVRRLRFHAYAALTPVMRALEEAHGVTEAALEALTTIELPRLRVLGIASRGGDGLCNGVPTSDGLRSLMVTTGLPALREIHLFLQEYEVRGNGTVLRGPADYRWLLESALGARLEAVHVQHHARLRHVLPAWFKLVGSGRLRRFGIELHDARVVVQETAGALVATARLLPYVQLVCDARGTRQVEYEAGAESQARLGFLRDLVGIPLVVADDHIVSRSREHAS